MKKIVFLLVISLYIGGCDPSATSSLPADPNLKAPALATTTTSSTTTSTTNTTTTTLPTLTSTTTCDYTFNPVNNWYTPDTINMRVNYVYKVYSNNTTLKTITLTSVVVAGQTVAINSDHVTTASIPITSSTDTWGVESLSTLNWQEYYFSFEEVINHGVDNRGVTVSIPPSACVSN